MRKTNPLTRGADHFQHRSGLFSRWLTEAFLILLLGVSAGRAEPFSFSTTNEDRAPTLAAWEKDLSPGSAKSIEPAPDTQNSLWRSAFWPRDQVDPWKAWKKKLPLDPSSSDFGSGPGLISVPAVSSDAALELQSIPMDEDLPGGILLWSRTPEDAGSAIQFSQHEDLTLPAASVAAEANNRKESLALPAVEADQVAVKVEFSSTDSAALHLDSSRDPGDLTGSPDELPLSPPGPIPQIISPEPTVTALWGVSALLFACRRKLRSKS
jgi:hypothetical protein